MKIFSIRRRKFDNAYCPRLFCDEISFENENLDLFLCAEIGMLDADSFGESGAEGVALKRKRRQF